MKKWIWKNPACVIDANHSNSNKQFRGGSVSPRKSCTAVNSAPICTSWSRGVMIGSYIGEGNQKVGAGCYGKSITDPVWGLQEDSERLITDIAEYGE